MHPTVVYAANLICGEKHDAEARARRVLAAQAKPEAIPSGAVEAAMLAWLTTNPDDASDAMRAALSAALLYMAGGE